jgi:hypothetical protein
LSKQHPEIDTATGCCRERTAFIKFARDLRCGGVAPLASLSQTSLDDALEFVRNIAYEVHERLRFLANYCSNGLGGGLTLERPMARQHLIEHRAESEDIAACVGLFCLQLFRRH